ncbi:MAG: ParA family protein [Pseudomonadota bacterium]
MMKTLVPACQKGGVGKTFFGCQFPFYLVQEGLRVLHIDLDHQKNASRPLAVSGRAQLAPFTSNELLLGRAGAVPDAPFVSIQGDDALSSLERQPEQHNAIVNALHDFIASMGTRFDVCVIDTNPNPDIRYAAALICADFLLSPIELNQEAIDGIAALLHHQRYGYHRIKARLNPGLELLGILPNRVEATPFQRANFAQLVAAYAPLLIAIDGSSPVRYAYIANRTAIAEAQAAGVPLWQLRQVAAVGAGALALQESMPVRSAAREAWRDIKPVFDTIARRMGFEL